MTTEQANQPGPHDPPGDRPAPGAPPPPLPPRRELPYGLRASIMYPGMLSRYPEETVTRISHGHMHLAAA